MFSQYIHIVVVPISAGLLFISNALSAEDLTPPNQYWQTEDKAPNHQVYTRKCNAKNKKTCPMISVEIKPVTDKTNHAHLDQLIVGFVEKLEKRAHSDIEYDILELGEVDIFQVLSKRQSHEFIHLISVTPKKVHYFEYSGSDKYFTRHQKDFKAYWAGRMREVQREGNLASSF